MDPWTTLIVEAKQRRNTAFEEMKEDLTDNGFNEHSAKENASRISCSTSRKNWKIFICSAFCG